MPPSWRALRRPARRPGRRRYHLVPVIRAVGMPARDYQSRNTALDVTRDCQSRNTALDVTLAVVPATASSVPLFRYQFLAPLTVAMPV